MAIWFCRAGKHGEHENRFLEENRKYSIGNLIVI